MTDFFSTLAKAQYVAASLNDSGEDFYAVEPTTGLFGEPGYAVVVAEIYTRSAGQHMRLLRAAA